jgi:hypothetical protein
MDREKMRLSSNREAPGQLSRLAVLLTALGTLVVTAPAYLKVASMIDEYNLASYYKENADVDPEYVRKSRALLGQFSDMYAKNALGHADMDRLIRFHIDFGRSSPPEVEEKLEGFLVEVSASPETEKFRAAPWYHMFNEVARDIAEQVKTNTRQWYAEHASKDPELVAAARKLLEQFRSLDAETFDATKARAMIEEYLSPNKPTWGAKLDALSAELLGYKVEMHNSQVRSRLEKLIKDMHPQEVKTAPIKDLHPAAEAPKNSHTQPGKKTHR